MRNFAGLDLHACIHALERLLIVNFVRKVLVIDAEILCKIFWLLMMKAFAKYANFTCEFYLIRISTKNSLLLNESSKAENLNDLLVFIVLPQNEVSI